MRPWFSRCCDGVPLLLSPLLIFLYLLLSEWQYIKYNIIETKTDYLTLIPLTANSYYITTKQSYINFRVGLFFF